MNAYEVAWSTFPPAPMAFGLSTPNSRRPQRASYFSAQTALLSELEQIPLHNSINFGVPTGYLTDIGAEAANLTAAAQVVAGFLCPSDGGTAQGPYGANSYRAQRGGVCGYCEDGVEDGAFTFSERGTRTGLFCGWPIFDSCVFREVGWRCDPQGYLRRIATG